MRLKKIRESEGVYMKKSTAARIACREAQLRTIEALISHIPYPVAVKAQDGSELFHNKHWSDDTSPDEERRRFTEIEIDGYEGEHLCSIHLIETDSVLHPSTELWNESALELKSGLSSLVAGWRVPLPPPDRDDPLRDVKREFNAALETVERLISVSKLF